LYILVWSVIFHFLESHQWDFLDAWFFCCVTIATVGYGILTPSSDATRGMVVLFLVLGLAFATFTMGIVTDIFLGAIEARLRQIKETAEPGTEKRAWLFCTRNRCGPRTVMAVAILFVISFTGILYGILYEEWNFIASLYFTFVTFTTVGYGDLAPKGKVFDRVFMSFYVLFSAGIFASLLSAGIANMIAMRRRGTTLEYLYTPDEEAINEMDKDLDGQVTRQEFMEYILVKVGMVRAEELIMVNEAYDAIDTNKDGVLSRQEMEQGAELMQSLRDKYNLPEDVKYQIPGMSTYSIPLLGTEE